MATGQGRGPLLVKEAARRAAGGVGARALLRLSRASPAVQNDTIAAVMSATFARSGLLPALLLAALLGLPAAAQTQTISLIKVTGSRHFTSQAIVQASGLRVGGPFSPALARQAVNRLTATGAFAHISYTFFPAGAGVGIQMKLQDAAHFAPAEFDNFVWFTPAQLNAAIEKAIPLYHGQLPAYGGGLADQIVRRLEALLARRGIHATVQYLTSVGGAGRGPEVQFSIVGLRIPMAAITFPGAAAALQPRLAATVRSELGSNFSWEVARGWTHGPSRAVYLRRGYLAVQLGPPRVTLAPGAAPRARVDVALPVRPGPVYHLASALALPPLPQLPPAAVAKRFAAAVPAADRQPGAVANPVALQRGVAAVVHLYHRYGYFSAHAALRPHLQKAQALVTYGLAAVPGPRYAMGKLVLEGWPQSITQRLRRLWKLAPGQPYSGIYMRHFLVTAITAIRAQAVFTVTADPRTLTVDVAIRPGA